MDQFTSQPDLALQLPRDMYYQLIHTLSGCLPPPRTNSPEDRIRHENAIIARIASMLPANADEAHIAGQCIAAQAQSDECLRLSQVHIADERLFMRFTALSVGMMRQSNSARSLLMRVQAQREKREADADALNQANWIEHCAIGLMADALGRAGHAPMEEPAPPASVEEAEPQTDLAAEADQYAIIHPRRAALMRRLGGLPEKCTFGPPSVELVDAIVTGRSPILCALDGATAAAAPLRSSQ
jgi:hypothetical protein